MDLDSVRHDVWSHAKQMWEAGLVVGSAGNVSRRVDASTIAITPTAVPYDRLTPEEIVFVDLDNGAALNSLREPSYELPMHLVMYRSNPAVGAVVHTHAPNVTTLSVLRRPLPPMIDEMMMYFGGVIEVTDYAFTGTPQAGENVMRALGDRTGVILANHGNVCVGRNLGQALHVAIVMESCARVYVHALATGDPVLLPDHAIESGRRLFEERYRL